jgi:uncharacterized protein YpmB
MKNYKNKNTWIAIIVVVIVAVIGSILLFITHAATPSTSINADKGSLANCAQVQ